MGGWLDETVHVVCQQRGRNWNPFTSGNLLKCNEPEVIFVWKSLQIQIKAELADHVLKLNLFNLKGKLESEPQ